MEVLAVDVQPAPERPRVDIRAEPFLITPAVMVGVAFISLLFGCNIEDSLDVDLALMNMFAGVSILVISALLVKVSRSSAIVDTDSDMYESDRCYEGRVKRAKRVEPVLRYLSRSTYALAVVHICRPFTRKPLHLVWDLPWTMNALLWIGWVGGTVSFFGFVYLSLALPCWLASMHIQRLDTSLRQRDDATTRKSWYEEGKQVHETNKAINREFELSETGLLWLALLVATASSAILGMFLVVRSEANTENHTVGMTLFFLGGILTAAILLPLALLNRKCDIFLEDARIHFFRHGNGGIPTDDVQAAHHRFVSFVEKIDLGIKLCGVRITLQWVVTRFTSIVVVMPSLYAWLLAHFKTHSTQHLQAWESFK
mmetsp:Transcript_52899/g.133645  ORF Transcript_52899/g.133645 Transcript_52899/m.133645 type:complete len:370 (-) Transcript_52899:80-1189(-)|eukprot:CAMPEP_0115617312 /NCGR_PEP_ID=MMETSP0272-20121206/23582_1 /TAXON_ID=71861 /ORGANISM="Scrippsiella trochoidea, Strain CCMP3099" /LENGTH=369 /DNA_ID=CAMNT_0003053269 /DNA_START=55 /DNA_END=1164 /DNA_ORIENTATION=-